MIGTWLSILPPIIAIVMVLATRRVLLSLGAGIVAAALLAASFSPVESLQNLWNAMIVSFWDRRRIKYIYDLYYAIYPSIRCYYCIC